MHQNTNKSKKIKIIAVLSLVAALLLPNKILGASM